MISRSNAKEMALIVYESGAILYVCKAAIGTALAAPLWSIKKVDTTSGVKIEWADGDSNYDNLATDLGTVAALAYS